MIRLLRDFSGEGNIPTTRMQEVQDDKVVIQAGRSVHNERYEGDGILTISIQSPIVQDLRSDHVL